MKTKKTKEPSQKEIDQAFIKAGGIPKEEKRKQGQPSKFKEEYSAQLIKIFDDAQPWYESPVTMFKDGKVIRETMERKANAPPFVSAFARKVGVCTDTLYEWGKVHPSFSVALKHARDRTQEIMAENGLLNLYNATFTIFAAKNMIGWTDKHEVEHSGEVKSAVIEIHLPAKREE